MVFTRSRRACIVGACVYLALLPQPQLTRETYISENALMPDYVPRSASVA